jgi:hypothetical protein
MIRIFTKYIILTFMQRNLSYYGNKEERKKIIT